MSCLHYFVALLSLVASTDAGQTLTAIHQEEPQRYVDIERPEGAPVAVPVSDEILAREDLVGTWQAVFLEHEGEPLPAVARDLQMRFSRGRLELMQRGRPTIVVAYSLETKQYPHHFGWTLRSDGCLLMQKGVLWHEGDTLMLCVGPVNMRRASEFLTQPGDGRTLFVLERVEPRGNDPSQPGDDPSQPGE